MMLKSGQPPENAVRREPKKVNVDRSMETSGGYTRHSLGRNSVEATQAINTAGQQTGDAHCPGRAGNRTRMSVPPKVEVVPGMLRGQKPVKIVRPIAAKRGK